MAEPELNTEVHSLPAEGREEEGQREHSQLHALLWLLCHAVPGVCRGGGGGCRPCLAASVTTERWRRGLEVAMVS